MADAWPLDEVPAGFSLTDDRLDKALSPLALNEDAGGGDVEAPRASKLPAELMIHLPQDTQAPEWIDSPRSTHRSAALASVQNEEDSDVLQIQQPKPRALDISFHAGSPLVGWGGQSPQSRTEPSQVPI